DVFVGEAEAAGGNAGADRLWRVGAVDAIDRAAEIHRPRTERIAGAAGHVARQIGLAGDHFRGRRPGRPFGLAGDGLRARPGEAVAADADAVAHRLAVAEHEVEVRIRHIDNDGANRLPGSVVDQSAT